jgi:citrate lyase beta subunit
MHPLWQNTRPRRSLLFVPGSHARAMEKAKKLPADALIFDLEDGVSAAAKEEARARIRDALKSRKAYGHRELLVRINPLATPEGLEDFSALASAGADGLMLPKVESAAQIDHAASLLAAHGMAKLPVWANVETPLGVLRAGEIAAHPACCALVAGTNDLRLGLGLSHGADRSPLLFALQSLLIAARAFGRMVFDGTYLHFGDAEGLRAECQEGRLLGFDGKTLVHPEQIGLANEIFSPTEAELRHARAVISRHEETEAAGRSVGLLGNVMIEALHARRAQQVLALHHAIEKIEAL